ncbi:MULTISPECIES: Ig-like domain-containing protein [Streptacidiphilus]|uniref:Ig-like domain repeat protein n=1 Tax=Streptacidiphilus cavernicola TaxID=3342716 RepID=A0ABV6UEE9_9ACTN|nr:Ig-like domain-containing protein [Streptacidiphilus jeojiense]
MRGMRSAIAAAAALAVLAGTSAVLGTGAAAADTGSDAGSGFAAGDVVVYRVGDGTSTLSGAGSAVFLDEYSPAGSLVRSVALPTTAVAGSSGKPIVASGSASSEGGLTLSADSRYLVATGYDAAVGATGLSSSAAATVPRTVATVDAAGTVDSSTALTDFSDGNNPRSAVSDDGQEFWVGGAAGGVRYAALGASTSTSLVAGTYKNVRQLAIADGQLYTSADPSKASVTVATVGTGLPTTGTQAVTNLPFTSSPSGPYSYSLLTLGTGSSPDTLYVADNSVGAVVKYGLVSGAWVQQGSVAVPSVTGLTANDDNGTVSLYATSSGSSGTAGTLYRITDASGTGGTLSGSATVLASAPAGETFRGVAFAPGTVTGTGGGTRPPAVVPTVTTAHSGLAAALGNPTDPGLDVTVGDPDPAVTPDQIKVTAVSSNETVAPTAGLTVTGDGADRTLTVTPAATGYATITLTATAPDGSSATTQVQYGVSSDLNDGADPGDAGQRYYSGAGNASAAVDVGGGYMIVADDESNVLRLYDETRSGPPVRTFDFTSQLPAGTAEADLESAARVGDTVYWGGSMSNSSSGAVQASRSTVFATTVTGSGADTQLSYVGGYTGLQSDLVAWDQANGHGLGADYLGLAQSVQSGIGGHEDDALNVEGMEFAPGSTSTAYLTFRAPLEPTTDRHLALVVPVTDMDRLTDPSATGVHATFGAPILMNLGGLGIRDIRRNADGQYLIIAGTADGTNSPFVLYSWDGKPADPPLSTGLTLPQEPAGADHGSWETIVDVPDPLTAGAPVRLLQDDGDTAWYGDGRTSKTGLPADLQKSLGQVFSYSPGTPLAAGTTLSSTANPVPYGSSTTLTAQVAATDPGTAVPGGTVSFAVTSGGRSRALRCSAGAGPVALTGGTARCTVDSKDLGLPGSYTLTASYSGSAFYTASSGSLVQKVGPTATTTTVTLRPATVGKGQGAVVEVSVSPASTALSLLLGGRVTVTVLDASGTAVPCTGVLLPGVGGVCTVAPGRLSAAKGPYTVTAAFAGNQLFAASSGTAVLTVKP